VTAQSEAQQFIAGRAQAVVLAHRSIQQAIQVSCARMAGGLHHGEGRLSQNLLAANAGRHPVRGAQASTEVP
jgi:hypothetical protein